MLSCSGRRVSLQKRMELIKEWKDKTKYWIPLKDIKESNTVDTAEYADANNLLETVVSVVG